jgi:hypothetical protein
MQKKNYFSCRLNNDNDGARRTVDGGLFRILGPATRRQVENAVHQQDVGVSRRSELTSGFNIGDAMRH